MHRTTVSLDKRLLRRARQFARRQGKSLAEVVREALAAYIDDQRSLATRLPSIAGRFGTRRSHVSRRADELLWTDPHSGRYRVERSAACHAMVFGWWKDTNR